jgi:hypothetical protein
MPRAALWDVFTRMCIVQQVTATDTSSSPIQSPLSIMHLHNICLSLNQGVVSVNRRKETWCACTNPGRKKLNQTYMHMAQIKKMIAQRKKKRYWDGARRWYPFRELFPSRTGVSPGPALRPPLVMNSAAMCLVFDHNGTKDAASP